jgi:multiple antibiotic resistance protein
LGCASLFLAMTPGCDESTRGELAKRILAAIIGAAIVALSILLAYRYAEPGARLIGHTGMTVAFQLSAFIVLCIGVGITWNGLKSLLAHVGIHG